MDKDVELIQRFRKSPLFFIENMWGLTPQPVKDEYKEIVEAYLLSQNYSEIKKHQFKEFVKGQHITWQQWVLFRAIELAIEEKASHRISVVSGHGIGKSCSMSWVIIWFLFCWIDAQVPCTAPTSEQMHDILWKELKIWIDLLPEEVGKLYEWTGGYLRMKERPETWFARAKTARQDKPEALAGVHGDHVLFVIDEASGVPEEVYNTGEGALTGEDVLVLMISNGTRNEGYFYDSHHNDSHNWQNLSFNSEDSPLVNETFINRIIEKFGKDSDEYRVRVSGGFPNSEQMDDGGWIPLILPTQMFVIPSLQFQKYKKLGIDPAGEGDDKTVLVCRDRFFARIIGTEKTSNEKTVAKLVINAIKELVIDPAKTWVDNFGIGANVSKEVLLGDDHYSINGVNWGDEADDSETYTNKRAECYFRARSWLLQGGMLGNEEIKSQLSKIKYKNNLNGTKQIMPKPKMKVLMGKSPDEADAFALTFYEEDENIYNYNHNVNQPTHSNLNSAI